MADDVLVLLQKIRAAGIIETCKCNNPEAEKSGAKITLYCVACGFRYALTDRETDAVKAFKMNKGRPRDYIRDHKIAVLYKSGMSSTDICKVARVNSSTLYQALQRFGVPLQGHRTQHVPKPPGIPQNPKESQGIPKGMELDDLFWGREDLLKGLDAYAGFRRMPLKDALVALVEDYLFLHERIVSSGALERLISIYSQSTPQGL
jgi:hypothetical protein